MGKPSLLKTLEGEANYGLAVYPLGSLVNHSCIPTANRLPLSKHLVVRAATDLAPGTELTYAYVEVRAPVETRRASLDKSWGFDCQCWSVTFVCTDGVVREESTVGWRRRRRTK